MSDWRTFATRAATTTRLRLTVRDRWLLHERSIRNGAVGGMFVVTLLLIHSLLRPTEAQPTTKAEMRPVILVVTATSGPTATIAPSQSPIVRTEYVQVPVIVEAAPTQPPPEVVYVEVAPPPPAFEE